MLVLSMIFVVPLTHAAGATIWTDKPDYCPEETVTISGSGFLASASVTVTITRPDSTIDTIYALTDDSGAFSCTYQLNGITGTYNVVATDEANTATATFTDTMKYFTSTISPTTANTGQTQTYAITITNDPSSSEGVKLGSATISIPSGFTSVSITSVTASAGKSWTATVVSGKIKLTANSNSDRLNRGEHVSVSFSATAPALAGTYVWTTTAYTSPSWAGDLFNLVGSQPKVTVTAPTYMYFTSTISPTTCFTGETKTYTIAITNDMSSSSGVTLDSATVTIPLGFTAVTILNVSPPSGKTWTANVVSGKINLDAQHSSDDLSRGQSVSVTFSATAPGTTGTYEWTTKAYACEEFTIIPPQPTVTVAVPHPAIDVSKSGPVYAHEGDRITYTITVTNPSTDTTMYKVSVIDSLLGDISGSFSASLAPSTSESKTYVYIVPTPSGDVTNTVTVTYKDVLNEQKVDSASWTVTVLHPGISVSKSGPAYAHENDTITYTITVTNTGDCKLYDVSVTDTLLGSVWSGDLDTGVTMTFTVNYTVPTPSGDITNTVTASGYDALDLGVSDSADWTVAVLHPAISVSKSGPSYAHEGDVISYTITVSNPSTDTTMTKVSVVDSLLGDVSGSFSASLAPLASESRAFTYTVPTPSGDILNTVTATYKNGLDQPKTAYASWTVAVLHPAISVSKSGPLYAHEGDVITYTITVSNTGDCALHGVFVTDIVLGPIYGNGLALGETKTFAWNYTILIPSGDILNTVTASGSDILGLGVSDSASWFVKVQYQITVTASPPEAIGGTFDVTYTKSGTTYSNAPETTAWTEWVDSSTTVTVSSSQDPINDGPDARYRFDHYDPSASVSMTGPMTITLVYVLQYNITYCQTGVGSDFTDTVVVINGTNYGVSDLPASFWYDDGSTSSFAFQSPLLVGLGAKQYDWDSTTGLSSSQSGSINVTGSGSITGNYVTRVHDVAVTDIVITVRHCKWGLGGTWVFQGRQANISVTIINNGDFQEDVSTTLYYNITANRMIGTQNTTLLIGENKTLLFVWNTANVPYCHNYTITAVATIMPADYTPADNTRYDGNIKVRILGDLNGDGVVDGADIAIAAWSFAAYGPNYLYPGSPPSPRWNLDCDINEDLKIDGADLVLIARNFGMCAHGY